MEVAYAFLNVKPGARKAAISKLKAVEGVKEAKTVLGAFDAIVRIEGETIREIESTYLNEIENVPELTASRLYIVACPRTRK